MPDTKRTAIRQILNVYGWTWAQGRFDYRGFLPAEEMATLNRIHSFVDSTEDCFERTHSPGHLTGSALVVNADLSQVLLTLHRKLRMWLQLGGHADGHPLMHDVAMREAEEESGMTSLQFLPYEMKLLNQSWEAPLPFDLDVHGIPGNPREDEHFHYDINYLIVADQAAAVVISEESQDLKWFSVEAARTLNPERSMTRKFDKLARLRTLLNP